ncbi:hypothetical protein MMC29_002192 [Sticta canariensis]|nr:hypothetical protein [Sticta canariensis]
MPAKNFFHKNRSQGSLLNVHDSNDRRSYHASLIESPLHSPVYAPHSLTSASQSPHDDDHNHDPDHRLSRSNRSDEARFYQTLPSRTQSQRSPPSNQTFQGHLAPPHTGVTQAAVDENPDSFYQQSTTSIAPRDERKRRFFGPWSSKEPADNNGGPTSQKLGRNISVRRKAPATPQISTETSSRQVHQRNPNVTAPSASEEVYDRVGAGLNPSHLQPAGPAPPIPEKDSLRSPQFSDTQQQESPYSRAPSQGVVPTISNRQPLERHGSANSTIWENTVRPTQQSYRPPPQSQYHQPQVYQPSPSSATSTSSHPLPARGAYETPSQHYQNSSRPSSRQSFGPPSPLQQNPRADPYGPGLNETSPYPPSSMAPSSQQQQPPGRGSNDTQPQRAPGVAREGSGYPNYSQSSQDSNQPPNVPPQYRELGPGNNYRAPPQGSPLPPQPNLEQERSTPPPSRSRDDLAGLDPAQLLVRHDELQEKYRKVKKYYFDKDAQVQQLQNTLAHQRLSQSRTSLDDNEYANRFARLDGAINNLAFNIRRDWRAVPPWLGPHVNRDAPTLPTREMTAVGRACISRWLVDELLDRHFHPSLEPALSAHLKIIEKNLRRFAAPTPSEEEKDGLMARISNWRLATLDGLQDILSSSQAAEFRSQLTDQLVEKLTASLSMGLKDPVPAELEGGVRMIIELAVGIAANLPLESRDVFVDYVSPGTLVNEAYMKVETGLPPLKNPGEGILDGARAGGAAEKTSDDSNVVDPKDNNPGEDGAASTGGSSAAGSVVAGTSSGASTKETKKKSMFGGFMSGGKKAVASVPPSVAHQQQPQPPQPPKEEKVRFAAFMAVEVRGRSVLVKAPVYV